LALALVFRVLFLLAMPRVLDTADGIHYIETANHFAAGDFLGFDPKIPVLYPLLGALVHLVVTDMEWALRVVSFVASVLLVVPVYFLAREMHGVAAARVAGITVGIWTWLADYGCRVATEATATLWWFTGVWALASAVRHGGRFVWIAPLPFIALYLTRPEGLFVMLAAPAFALLLCGKPDKEIVQRLVPFAGLGAIAVLLNTLLMRHVTGAATANYRIGFILEDFDFARFGHTALSTVTEVFPVMLGPALLLFLGIGLFYPRSAPRDLRIERYVFAFIFLQWAVSLFVLSPAPRYLMSPLIALSIWSASGIAFSAEKVAGLPRGKWLRMLPLGAVVVTMMANAVVTVGAEHLGHRPREPREYKEAGLWMKENLEGGLIFSRKPQIGYYAGMRSTGPAVDDSLEEAVARAVAAEAQYFVVDERYSTEALLPLLERENAPASLRFLQEFDRIPEARVMVYEIRSPKAATQE
jgi:4-amino-4-deoxy-L-arabinose transferase-like glycosyltransferase